MDTLRKLPTIGANDQRQIQGWVQGQVDNLAPQLASGKIDVEQARRAFVLQHNHAGNGAAFRLELAVQIVQLASSQFADPDLDDTSAYVLALVLRDLDRAEAIDGIVAGLRSNSARARVICASELVSHRAAIVADPQRLSAVVAALKRAGLAELDPIVLKRIYAALAIPGQLGAVFDAYMALFDKRLDARRALPVKEDGAELEAYEFFRSGSVLSGLDSAQRAQLVSRLAVFFRMGMERYQDSSVAPPTLPNVLDTAFVERDKLQRMLVAVEEVFVNLIPAQQAKISAELKRGPYLAHLGPVGDRVSEWIGDAKTATGGILNEAPWSVAPGAP